jgi:hypothetical protein
MKICRDNLNLIRVGQKYWIITWRPNSVLLLPATLNHQKALSSTESGCLQGRVFTRTCQLTLFQVMCSQQHAAVQYSEPRVHNNPPVYTILSQESTTTHQCTRFRAKSPKQHDSGHYSEPSPQQHASGHNSEPTFHNSTPVYPIVSQVLRFRQPLHPILSKVFTFPFNLRSL